MPELSLPSAVEILDPSLEVDELATRFLPFDALHDGLEICVPASGSDLDATVEAMEIARETAVLDVACGHGGLLHRLAARSSQVTGIDLSPWALARSATLLRRHRLQARLWLGDAARLPFDAGWERITCIGAAWIFHGYTGTWRALARRLRPGGRIAVGDLRRRQGAGPPDGRVPTVEEQRATIETAGGRIVAEIVSAPEAWDAYGRAVLAAADRFHRRYPRDPAADQRALARRWVAEAEKDRALLEFAIVVADFGPSGGPA